MNELRVDCPFAPEITLILEAEVAFYHEDTIGYSTKANKLDVMILSPILVHVF